MKRTLAVLLAMAAVLAVSCAPMGGRTGAGPSTVPPPALPDSGLAAADSLAADPGLDVPGPGAATDSISAASPDSILQALGRTSVETRSAAEAKRKPAPVPPLNISAANVTGSRGDAGDIVMLNGDVRITRGRTVITADNGRYERSAGMLYLDDRVRLVDSATVVTCDHASYSETQDLLWLRGNVVVRDRSATLRAPTGEYDRRTGRAALSGGVEAEDSTQVIQARNVTYWRERQLLEARGAVEASDLANRITLRADTVDYDRVSQDAAATGSPELESVDEEGRSTFIRSRRMRLNTGTRIALAVDSVRIVRDTLEARADSALFDDKAERGWLLGNPSAQDAETKVTGDTLEIWTERRELRRFVVRGNAVIDYRGGRETTLGEASRLSGERVDVFFTEQRMDSLVALGGARNDYTAIPREGKTPESNLASGDTIVVHFRDRKIHRALVTGKANGEYRFAVNQGDTAAARAEFVRYEAPRIEFRVPEDLIVLEPKASIRYKEMSLTANEVQFDSRRQTLVARGDPELVDKGDRVVGDVMSYDIESQSGTIYEAETDYEKGKYRGHQIRKVGDDVLNVQEGTYTTCDLDEPHFHFKSQYMKITLKDKLVARPVIFYVRHVPMMALPFWVFPIKPGRHSGFLFPQVEFGFNTTSGQFIRNAGYYWAPSDYFDLTFTGDYYSADPSYVLRTEGVYRLLYVLNGGFNASYRNDEGLGREDYSFTGDHAQELTPRTRLIAGGQFVSSRDYQRDPTYGSNLRNRLNRFLTSKLYLTHNADWANFTAFVDRRQDLDADQAIRYEDGFAGATPPPIGTQASLPNLLESLPQLSVSFPTRSLGSFAPVRRSVLAKSLASLYVNLSATVQRQHERRAVVTGYAPYNPDPVTVDSTTVVTERDSVRSGASMQFSIADSRRLFGWLTLSPRFNANTALFDHDVFGNDWVPTGTWSAAFSSGATFYGTFAPNLGPLVGLRHVLFPSLSYSYSPDFPNLTYTDANGVERPRFISFGSIGVSGFRVSSMSFSLDQRLQAKLKRGDNVTRIDNLLSWTTSGSYNFLWREQNQKRGMSNLFSSSRLQPPGMVSADANSEIDPYSQRPLRRLGFNINASFAGNLRSGGPAGAGGGGGSLGGFGSADAAQTPYSSGFQASPDVLDQPWTLALAYSYSGGYGYGPGWTSTRYVNAILGTNLSRSWRFDYLATYDFDQREILTQRFALTRDLHCWFASFSRTFVVSGEAEYYFRLGIKDLREISYERGTRVQNFGGIQ